MIKIQESNDARIYARTSEDAINILTDLVGDIQLDNFLTDRAGYKVYTFDGGTVSQLNTRFEINYDDGRTVNIWIDSHNDNKANEAFVRDNKNIGIHASDIADELGELLNRFSKEGTYDILNDDELKQLGEAFDILNDFAFYYGQREVK